MVHPFFPKNDALLALWADNYKESILAHAVALGLTPAEVADEVDYCNEIVKRIKAVTTQKGLVKGFVTAKNTAIGVKGGLLRVEIARHKTALGYTESIGKDLGIVSSTIPFDPNMYKPEIHPSLFGGAVRVKFRKAGVNGINLYSRKKGSGNWLFVARTTKSPFNSNPVLQSPGQPEHWEYRAFGVINDIEIGFPSDIVEIIVGA